MPSPGAVIAFAGPCVADLDLDAIQDGAARPLEIRPPAQRGDVLDALTAEPSAILVLDGYYFSVPAVTHKELLLALESGVPVWGAASMGALRAAELETHGMVGVGKVFRWFRSGALDGDDEVAIQHAPAEFGYRVATVALVELRYALLALRRQGVVSRAGALRVIDRVGEFGFMDRTPAVVNDVALEELGAGGAGALRTSLEERSIKASDARDALRSCLTGVLREPSVSATERRSHTGYLGFYKEQRLCLPGPDSSSPTLARSWRTTQVLHPDAAAFVRQVQLRFMLQSEARRAGVTLDPATIRRTRERLETFHRDQFGRLLVPPADYYAEAERLLLATTWMEAHGPTAGIRRLSEALGPAASTPDLAAQRVVPTDQVHSWEFARAFAFSDALLAAAAVTVRVDEIYGCFERWAAGQLANAEDVDRHTAHLWDCTPEQVPTRAAERGMYDGSEFTESWRDSVARVAVAEALPEPINEYPANKESLQRSRLEIELPGLPTPSDEPHGTGLRIVGS